jgi:hypothetical protein
MAWQRVLLWSFVSMLVGIAMFVGMIVAGIVSWQFGHRGTIVRLPVRRNHRSGFGWLNSVPSAAGMQMMFACASRMSAASS